MAEQAAPLYSSLNAPSVLPSPSALSSSYDTASAVPSAGDAGGQLSATLQHTPPSPPGVTDSRTLAAYTMGCAARYSARADSNPRRLLRCPAPTTHLVWLITRVESDAGGGGGASSVATSAAADHPDAPYRPATPRRSQWVV
jgi:hypothetical protein